MAIDLQDHAEDFARFYEMLYQRPLPAHARRDWVKPLYAARAAGKGLVVTAFRGSGKTTALSIAFSAFRIGLQPSQSHLLVQASDAIAHDTSAQIAELIAHNPGWQAAFPHLVPDRKVSWGAEGYELNNTHYDYAAWRARCARDKGKDPTLVGLGYKSRAIIGKHPTGLLLVDDIHDETNTRSVRELDTVVKILTGTILPTATPETWLLVVGTPWQENDALAYLAATGRFKSASTPILRGQTPQWPSKFPKAAIRKLRKLSGEAEFARMYLLDLEAAQGLHLKPEWLLPYPHEKINPRWPVVMGVDYASTADELIGRRRDYFAVAIGRVLPGGGIVLVDGLRAHLSQGEAEQQIHALAAEYDTTQMIGVEAVGKGEEFYHLLLRTSRLPLLPLHPGGKSKGRRFEAGMAPLFQNGRARVANVETPFLRAFRDEWLRWPNGEHDDTLDAVAWMLHVGRSHIPPRPPHPAVHANPFRSLGRG
jgi:phage terminase large subunit-like protein